MTADARRLEEAALAVDALGPEVLGCGVAEGVDRGGEALHLVGSEGPGTTRTPRTSSS